MRRLFLHGCLGIFAGCGAPTEDCGAAPSGEGGADRVCAVPGWDDRDFTLHLPDGYDPDVPVAVVVVFHGGGGKKEGALRLTCPEGDEQDDGCLVALADREGFAVVAPDGTPNLLNQRTWNAGGGEDGWRCVSGRACKDGVDDLAYVDALLDEVRAAVAVDDARVYATGLSNGGAMSHRMACDRADVFAAVAPVAGANQFAAAQGCAPSRPVPVLHTHGTEDPCWEWGGGTGACLQDDGDTYVSVDASMDGWAERNGCAGDAVATDLPDTVDDGTTTIRHAWPGCAADVELLEVVGGGHTWPGGWSYMREGKIGPTALDFSMNEEMWAFFEAHPLP